MKKITLIILIIMVKINASSAQNTEANNDVKTNSGITFQNVKTQTINVAGTDFYYRKLGENTAGLPVIFLNHLAATMDNCDPRIMDGIASKHQITCFDNRGAGHGGMFQYHEAFVKSALAFLAK